jgi:hypothetical protein
MTYLGKGFNSIHPQRVTFLKSLTSTLFASGTYTSSPWSVCWKKTNNNAIKKIDHLIFRKYIAQKVFIHFRKILQTVK